MKKFCKTICFFLFILFFIFIYYYLALPAINFHSVPFWLFLITIGIFCSIGIGLLPFYPGKKPLSHTVQKNALKCCIGITGIFIAIFVVGMLLSSPVLNASRYRALSPVRKRNFAKDIQQISYDKLPLLDKESASLLGSRKMGSMIEYVSQFEVCDDYTQINYQGAPVRVTPLRYGNWFKWLKNQKFGIPAYLKINMATQEVTCVKLTKGIRYSQADHFSRNLLRHLRFRYPTYLFDQPNFELDENGTPYYVCPVKGFSIGLFGGQTVKNVILVNAITGEMKNYPIKDVPKWVDRVYPAHLLISYYNYYGTLQHGFLNSIFGQTGCLKTTEGYNYIVLDDDVWVYTGVTSVGGDKSNIGFVIMNQRTAETRFYEIPGAEEFSAMASAQGQVQNLGYTATFPLLLNVAQQPTYLIALKDDAGLVKKYAMVNISQYQIVAIGTTVKDCETAYVKLLQTEGIPTAKSNPLSHQTLQMQGTIQKIVMPVIDGNSYYYILLKESDKIFEAPVAEFPSLLHYDVGDEISFTYTKGALLQSIVQLL